MSAKVEPVKVLEMYYFFLAIVVSASFIKKNKYTFLRVMLLHQTQISLSFFKAEGMQLVPVTNPFLAREFGTSIATRDIESAAKFIGAGAATVGAAGIVIHIHYQAIHSLLPSFVCL